MRFVWIGKNFLSEQWPTHLKYQKHQKKTHNISIFKNSDATSINLGYKTKEHKLFICSAYNVIKLRDKINCMPLVARDSHVFHEKLNVLK